MSDLRGARCVGQWDLFDSTAPADHIKAAALCATCPALAACEQRRAWCEDDLASKVELVGTWAGLLHGGRANELRMYREDRMFNDDEARRAHTAWVRGDKTDRNRIGELVYQRRTWRRKVERREAEGAA